MTVNSALVAGLPDPDIVETIDVEAIIGAMRDELVSLYPDIEGAIDLESEPARMLLEVFGYREMLVRARVNDAARANLIAYATGTDLDHLATFYDVVRLVDETDVALRARTILAIAGRSPGGTEDRYEAVALGADVRVAAVRVCRCTEFPIVRVAVQAADNGGLPDQALLDAVDAALQATDVRVISDTIVVESAVTETTDVVADIWFDPQADTAVFASLEADLRAAWSAYGSIGRDLTRSWLFKTLMASGVTRVDIASPAADVIVGNQRAAAIGTVTLTNRGRQF